MSLKLFRLQIPESEKNKENKELRCRPGNMKSGKYTIILPAGRMATWYKFGRLTMCIANLA